MQHSLRARAIVSIMASSLLVTFGFAAISLFSVRTTLQEQAKTQVHTDFSNAVHRAQSILSATTATQRAAEQRLVSTLASTLQSSSSNNLLAIHIEEESTFGSLAPVSTDPSYVRVISSALSNRLISCAQSCILYQPVNTSDRGATPGAVLASVVSMPNGVRLHLFAVYSFASQQDSVITIQGALIGACIIMACALVLLGWLMVSSIITPVFQVATAASQLAQGALDTRVTHNRDDEIGVLQVAFNDMASSMGHTIDELEKMSAMQRRFVSDVSHELRTPVTTIRMASDLLYSRKQNFDETTQRTVELLNEQTVRFQTMLADLLEISRYDAGSMHVDFSSIDIRPALEQAIEDIKQLALVKHIAVHTHIPQREVMVYADSPRITRIVRNLLGNAVDFANGNPIEIALADNEYAWAIAVCDHGVGISQTDLPHIFERFWRADASRSRLTGGTGLGLAIAQLDAQIHHGQIEVRSRLGEGTCFIATFNHMCDETAPEQTIHASDKQAPITFDDETLGFVIRQSGDNHA